MIGTSISQYRIVDTIGTGGMGEVYLARDSTLGRNVALKRPRQDLSKDRSFRQRLVAEARAASKLLHPNITTVFEVLEEDDMPWLVMEYVEGRSLRRLLEVRGALSTEEVLVHSEGLAAGLSFAHNNGVLHRDVNPNNILVGEDGRARLSDFGLAKALVQTPGSDDSSTETLVSTAGASRAAGTRGYSAPEQALGRQTDPRSDIFSLGLVIYEMCSGHRAFSTEDNDWLDRLLHREPEPISNFSSETPPELERIVRKAIAKRPDERYQSATELLADLRTLRRKMEFGSDPDPVRDWNGQHNRSRRRLLLGIGSIGAVILVGGSAVIGTILLRGDTGPSLDWQHRQLTSARGWQGEPAVSPNGQLIAYVSEQSGNRDLWVIDASGGGQPLQLTSNHRSVSAPSWYPDGSTIAFVAMDNGTSRIWRIPALGGTAVPVLSNGYFPAISPDASKIAFAREGPSGFLRIWVSSVDDPSSAWMITSDDTGLWNHRHPSWSPDGAEICYAGFKDLWVISKEGTDARRITHDRRTSRFPRWWPNGRFVVHSSLRQGSRALWRVSSRGGKPARLSLGTGNELAPSVAANGSRIAYSSGTSDNDVVIINRVTETRITLESASQESSPTVAPDGSAVVFVSDRGGQATDLWIRSLEHGIPVGEVQRLTAFQGPVETPDYSPDGAWVAFFQVSDAGQRDIWIVPTTGGEPHRFTDDPAHDIHPAFSPDGRSLAFASDRAGSLNIWVAPIESGRKAGPPRQITRGPHNDMFPTWSPDGLSIAFQRNNEIWVAEVESEDTSRMVVGAGVAGVPRWCSSPLGLVATGTWDGVTVELRSVSLTDGRPVPFDPAIILGDGESPTIFDLSDDGTVIAALQSELDGDLWLMEPPADGRQ